MFTEKGDPTLEGWAIVDNTSGEDWTNVRLAVVSGKPVSFITQLYQPRYVQRPTIELAENQAANPVVYQGALDADAKKAEVAMHRPLRGSLTRPDSQRLGTPRRSRALGLEVAADSEAALIESALLRPSRAQLPRSKRASFSNTHSRRRFR